MSSELDALGDDLAEDEEGIPSYLREEGTELPDFVDEAPVLEKTVGSSQSPWFLEPMLKLAFIADGGAGYRGCYLTECKGRFRTAGRCIE